MNKVLTKRIALLLSGIFFMIGCSSKADQENVMLNNNFENINGWGCENPSITRDQAYSGRYAIKIDNSIEYSIGFNEELGKITSRKPKTILVEFEAFLYKDSKATLVVSIGAPGAPQSTLWEGIRIHKEADKYEQWVKIRKKIKVPDEVQFSDKFSCHLWRAEGTKTATYIDDLKITILE